jgi:hypothetical protein
MTRQQSILELEESAGRSNVPGKTRTDYSKSFYLGFFTSIVLTPIVGVLWMLHFQSHLQKWMVVSGSGLGMISACLCTMMAFSVRMSNPASTCTGDCITVVGYIHVGLTVYSFIGSALCAFGWYNFQKGNTRNT